MIWHLDAAPDAEAYQAIKTGVALFDHSDWGRLWISGPEGIEFLHNQSTNDIKSLQVGQGCETVFVTATAQILDLTTAYRLDQGIQLLTSPQRRQRLYQHLALLIRFSRGAQLEDQTETSTTLRLLGPASAQLLTKVGFEIDPDGSSHQINPITGTGSQGFIAYGGGFLDPGFTLWFEQREEAATLVSQLIEAGAVPASETVWLQLTMEQGRPVADFELTEHYNPIEAGLWSAVSLKKGCYVGQEVLAKQVTYHRLRHQLWGVRLQTLVEAGQEITHDDHKIGLLTRSMLTPSGYQGLAYIRTKADPQPGWKVSLNGSEGELIQLPLCQYPDLSA